MITTLYIINDVSDHQSLYSEHSIVSTQFRASPFERALFCALNRVSLKINLEN